MITKELKNSDTLFVDQAEAQIPYGTATLQLNNIPVRNSIKSMPISELKNGKFRRLFNRHHRALI